MAKNANKADMVKVENQCTKKIRLWYLYTCLIKLLNHIKSRYTKLLKVLWYWNSPVLIICQFILSSAQQSSYKKTEWIGPSCLIRASKIWRRGDACLRNFLKICAKFIRLNAKQEKLDFFQNLAQFDKILQGFTCFIAF